MFAEIKIGYEDASTKTKQQPNQGIVDTLTTLNERSLQYIDTLAYQ